MNTYADALKDRALPERSKLKFYFPVGEGDYTTVIIPFFENPIIRENKKARYKKHSLISRSSNLYTYLGADSRMFDLSFNITTPHILSEVGKTQVSNYTSYQQAYLSPFVGSYNAPSEPNSVGSLAQNLSSEYADLTTNIPEISNLSEEKSAVLDTINFWINVIRSSVLNNSKNPLIGPPIVRLIHGMMYRDIPCVCTDYNIEVNESAGYDLETLMPNQIKISLRLEEFRAGDSQEFLPLDNNPIKRDNLAGWEAVINGPTLSLDPGSGGIING